MASLRVFWEGMNHLTNPTKPRNQWFPCADEVTAMQYERRRKRETIIINGQQTVTPWEEV